MPEVVRNMPVISFAEQVPLLGMLMIPKTMAFLAVGFLTYFDLYRSNRQTARAATRQPIV